MRRFPSALAFLFLSALLSPPAEGFLVAQPTRSSSASATSSRLRVANFFDTFSAGGGGKSKPQDAKKPKHRVYQGMTKQEEAIRRANTYQGPRIRVREEEDAAMWIEEKGDNAREEKKEKKKLFGWG